MAIAQATAPHNAIAAPVEEIAEAAAESAAFVALAASAALACLS